MKTPPLILLANLLLLVCGLPGASTARATSAPTFDTPQHVITANDADYVVTGDFNGDGKPDVAVLAANTGVVEVHFRDATGGLSGTPASFTIPGSRLGMVAADLDGDGKSELIFPTFATSPTFSSSVLIYNWQSGVVFTSASIDLTVTGIHPTKVAVGDLSAAGHRDIVVSDDFGIVGAVVIPNNGHKVYGTPVVYAAGGTDHYSHPVVTDLTDLNGDHLADVVLSHRGTVGVLLNKGDGTLANEVVYSAPTLASFQSKGVAVADVDGDGHADIVVTGYVNTPITFIHTYHLVVYLGHGNGTFADGKVFNFAFNGGADIVADAIEASDLNGDGRSEIVTPGFDSGATTFAGLIVTRWTGIGATLDIEQQDNFTTGDGSGGSSLALGDQNGDGKVDVILGNSNFGSFYVFQNKQTATALPAIAQLVKTGPGTPGGSITFTTSTDAGLNVRVQLTQTPDTEGSWTDLADGNIGKMTEVSAGNYSLTTTAYPAQHGIFFRAISWKTGFTDGKSPNRGCGPFAFDKTLNFAQATIIVQPNGSELIIPVLRGSLSTGPVSVQFSVAGSAKAGANDSDYNIDSPAANTLTFGPTSYKEDISIAISGSTVPAVDKTIVLTLNSSPPLTGDAVLGTLTTMTVIIRTVPQLAIAASGKLTVTPTNKVTKTDGVKDAGRTFSDWVFSTTHAVSPDMTIKVQYWIQTQIATTPTENDWLDLDRGAMTREDSKSTKWKATSFSPPVADKIFFRTLSSSPGYASTGGKMVGPYKVVPGPMLGLYVTTESQSDLTGGTTHYGETITYHIKYTNVGNAPATNVVIRAFIDNKRTVLYAADDQDHLPPASVLLGSGLINVKKFSAFNNPMTGVFFGTQLQTETPPEPQELHPQIVAWNVGTVAAHTTYEEKLIVQVYPRSAFLDSSGGIGEVVAPGTVTISAAEGISDQKNSIRNPATTILSPLRMVVTDDSHGITTPNGLITYAVTAYNDTAFDWGGPVITDFVPAGTTLETIYDDNGTGNYTGTKLPGDPTKPVTHTNPNTHYEFVPYSNSVSQGQLQWTLDKIPAHDQRTVTFAVRVHFDISPDIHHDDGTIETNQIRNNNYNLFATPPTGGSALPVFTLTMTIPAISAGISGDPNLTPPILTLSKAAVGQGATVKTIYEADPDKPTKALASDPGHAAVVALVAPPDGGQVNGILQYELHYKNLGGATAKDVIIHDFINADTTKNAAITCMFLGKSNVYLNIDGVDANGNIISLLHQKMDASQIILKGGDKMVIPDSGDSRQTRSIDFHLGDLAPAAAAFDLYITYDVSASDGKFKPDSIGTVIRTGDFYLTSSSLTNPIINAPRETFSIVVQPVTLWIRHTPLQDEVEPDGEFFYHVDFGNDGGIPASGLKFKAPLAKGVIFEGFCDTNGTLFNPGDPNIGKQGTVSYQFDLAIPAGASGAFLIKCRLAKADKLPAALLKDGAQFGLQVDLDGGYMTGDVTHAATAPGHQAAAYAATTRGVSVSKFVKAAEVTGEVSLVRVKQPQYAQLWVAKKAPVAVNHNDKMTYTLFFGNTGNAPARNVTVGIYVPNDTERVTWSGNATYDKKSHVHTWSVGDLPANTAGSVTLTVHVSQDTGTIVENSTVIHADNAAGKVAGSNATTVVPTDWPGELHHWWNNLLGANHLNLGVGNSHPAVEADISHMGADSNYITFGGAPVTFLKNGVFIVPMGGDKVVVGGPPAEITEGTALKLASGDSDKLVFGNGSAIDLPGVGDVGGDNIVLIVHSIRDGTLDGNVVNGGTHRLIGPDNKTLVNNKDNGDAGPLPPQLGTATIGQNGESPSSGVHGAGFVMSGKGGIQTDLPGNTPPAVATGGKDILAVSKGKVPNDGASVVSNDGGSVISHDSGSVISHDSGSLIGAGGSTFR